jgi:hypothetical protein
VNGVALNNNTIRSEDCFFKSAHDSGRYPAASLSLRGAMAVATCQLAGLGFLPGCFFDGDITTKNPQTIPLSREQSDKSDARTWKPCARKKMSG